MPARLARTGGADGSVRRSQRARQPVPKSVRAEYSSESSQEGTLHGNANSDLNYKDRNMERPYCPERAAKDEGGLRESQETTRFTT